MSQPGDNYSLDLTGGEVRQLISATELLLDDQWLDESQRADLVSARHKLLMAPSQSPLDKGDSE